MLKNTSNITKQSNPKSAGVHVLLNAWRTPAFWIYFWTEKTPDSLGTTPKNRGKKMVHLSRTRWQVSTLFFLPYPH